MPAPKEALKKSGHGGCCKWLSLHKKRLDQRQGDDLLVAHICKRHKPIVVHVDADVKVEGVGVG